MILSAVTADGLRALADEDLAARAARDFDAFAELYGRYLCRIYRFLRAQTPDDPTAEDLTAHTFFRALSSADTFHGRGSYRSWIYRIAHNTLQTWRSKRAAGPVILEQVPEPLDPSPTPAAAVVSGEERRLVWELVATLPPAQREVLTLRYLEDLTTEEIAGITRRSRGAVRILLHRARASLRRAIEDGGHR